MSWERQPDFTWRGYLVEAREKAICCASKDAPMEPDKFWLPRSQLKSILKFNKTGRVWTPVEIVMTAWIAKQKGLLDEDEDTN